MMGGRAKRLGDYKEAARWYAEGARISPNRTYMLVNAAAMAVLQQPQSPQAGIELTKAREARRVDSRRCA